MAEAGRNGILVAMIVDSGSADEGKLQWRRKLQESIWVVSQKWHQTGQQQIVEGRLAKIAEKHSKICPDRDPISL